MNWGRVPVIESRRIARRVRQRRRARSPLCSIANAIGSGRRWRVGGGPRSTARLSLRAAACALAGVSCAPVAGWRVRRCGRRPVAPRRGRGPGCRRRAHRGLPGLALRTGGGASAAARARVRAGRGHRPQQGHRSRPPPAHARRSRSARPCPSPAHAGVARARWRTASTRSTRSGPPPPGPRRPRPCTRPARRAAARGHRRACRGRRSTGRRASALDLLPRARACPGSPQRRSARAPHGCRCARQRPAASARGASARRGRTRRRRRRDGSGRRHGRRGAERATTRMLIRFPRPSPSSPPSRGRRVAAAPPRRRERARPPRPRRGSARRRRCPARRLPRRPSPAAMPLPAPAPMTRPPTTAERSETPMRPTASIALFLLALCDAGGPSPVRSSYRSAAATPMLDAGWTPSPTRAPSAATRARARSS